MELSLCGKGESRSTPASDSLDAAVGRALRRLWVGSVLGPSTLGSQSCIVHSRLAVNLRRSPRLPLHTQIKDPEVRPQSPMEHRAVS